MFMNRYRGMIMISVFVTVSEVCSIRACSKVDALNLANILYVAMSRSIYERFTLKWHY